MLLKFISPTNWQERFHPALSNFSGSFLALQFFLLSVILKGYLPAQQFGHDGLSRLRAFDTSDRFFSDPQHFWRVPVSYWVLGIFLSQS